jgi:hypothetical protein
MLLWVQAATFWAQLSNIGPAVVSVADDSEESDARDRMEIGDGNRVD